MGKESGLIYKSFVDAVRQLDDTTQLEAMNAYYDYLFEGLEYEGQNIMVKALMLMAKPSIDKAQNRYDTACENGKKGGAPKGNQNARKQPENNLKQPENNQKTTKNNLNDNDTDTEADTDNDNEAVNDNDDVNENIPCAPAGASPLPYTLSQQVKQKVVKEGDLTDLANETWIEPANLKQIGKDIYVTTKHFRAAMHIRDRYGGYFENAIRSVIPDTGAILYATG